MVNKKELDIELKENEQITDETINELSNGKGEDDE